jgi:cell division protein FtsL
MAKPQKRHGKAGLLFGVLVVVLLAALGWQLWRLQGQLSSARAQQEQLQSQVDEKQAENDALAQDIAEGGSQEKKEQIARDELGVVSPGEKVFYDVGK